MVVLAGMEMVQNMGEEYTAAFRAALPSVSEQYGGDPCSVYAGRRGCRSEP